MRPLALAVACLSACSSEDFERLKAEAAPVRETSHLVAARFERGAGIFTVTRTWENPGVGYEKLDVALELPEAAVVTSLRVAGNAEELLDADAALTRWDDLQTLGEAAPTASALLMRSIGGSLRLRIYGLAPGAAITVSYDVQAPPIADGDRWRFDYPADATVDVTRIPGATLDQTEGAFTVHVPRGAIDRVDAKWATYRLGAARAVWRFELDAAAVLEPAPLRPNVVFVVDASHSMGAEGIAAQLELIAPYLASALDAQVEVVLYRRTAGRLFGRFVPAGDVARLLAAMPAERLAPGNGSHLELGAKVAADALASTFGAGRIVLFTDDLLRDAFTNEQAIAALVSAPKDTVVHVVDRYAGASGLSESRSDDHARASIAAASGGVAFRISGRVEDAAEAVEVMRGLVRPVRIDSFAVTATGLDGDAIDAPGVLVEGASERYQAIAEHVPNELKLTGKIWGRAFERVVPVDGNLSGWLPGIALGTRALEQQLTDDEVRDAAVRIRAVSRMTSYLSIAPRAGPSTIGVDGAIGDAWGYGIGGIGCSSRCGGATGCRFGLGLKPPNLVPVLKAMLADGVAACARTHGAASLVGAVTLEATGDEVVDVTVAAETAPLAACIGEVAWGLRLTEAFSGHRTYEVPFD